MKNLRLHLEQLEQPRLSGGTGAYICDIVDF